MCNIVVLYSGILYILSKFSNSSLIAKNTVQVKIIIYSHFYNFSCIIFTDNKNKHLYRFLYIPKFVKIIIRYKVYYDYSSDGYYLMNNIIRDWFDNSKNKEELINNLNESINHSSKINIDDNNDKIFKERVKIAHEALYKKPDLQNWMQEKGAHNIKNDYGNFYVYRYRATYDRVLIGSYRNKLISYLMKTYKQQIEHYYNIEKCEIKGKENNNFYCGWGIEIKIKNENKEYILNFDRLNQLTIKKDDRVILEDNLNEYTFEEYKKRLQTEFFDKYIK